MGSNERKVNIPMCAALILLCLTMISIHLTSGLFARYTTSGSGSDTARVAKFDVDGIGGGEVSIVSTSGNDGAVSFTITNHSEVAISYTVGLEFGEAVKNWLNLTLDKTDESAGATGTFSTDGTICTFDVEYTLEPGSNASHNVLFRVSDWAYVTKKNTNIVDNGANTQALAFEIIIHAEQID